MGIGPARHTRARDGLSLATMGTSTLPATGKAVAAAWIITTSGIADGAIIAILTAIMTMTDADCCGACRSARSEQEADARSGRVGWSSLPAGPCGRSAH